MFAIGGITSDRYSRVAGYFILSMSGLGWLSYGVLRNEVTIWVVGAWIASVYCFKISELARTPVDGKLDEEDNV